MICVFAIVCAFRPDLSKRIEDLLSREEDPAVTTEINGAPSEAGQDVYLKEDHESEEETDLLQQNDGETMEETKPVEEKPGMEDGISSDYIPPDRSEVTMPEAMSGRNGYQQIEDEQEQVDETAVKEIQDRLETGYTGDGLEFDTQYYPYYAMLNEKGKHLYRQLYANANGLNPEFAPVERVTAGELKNIFTAVYNDHPKLFWMESAYAGKFTRNGVCVEIDLKFNHTAQDLGNAQALFDENARQILSEAEGLANDYEKERFVHDALIERVSYQIGAEMNQTAYSALVNRQTVCAGYARAFQYLQQQLGIPCYYCTGYAGESHAWNIVRLDDGYYNVDTTWDDAGDGTYDYFNKSDADYAGSHIRQEMSIYLPPCNGQAYRGLEPESSSLKSLEDVGMAEKQVLTDMQGYYADCYAQILQNGIGSYTFYNVIEGEELFHEWYQEYQTDNYRQAYMRNAMAEIGASSSEMTLEAEELQGGRYLISHRIWVR